MKKWLRSALLAFPLLAVSSAGCTYLDNPDHFLYVPGQHWREISGWTERVARDVSAADGMPMPRKNLIDEHIFTRMERDGIHPAPLAGDQEFFRRVYLDLTGR